MTEPRKPRSQPDRASKGAPRPQSGASTSGRGQSVRGQRAGTQGGQGQRGRGSRGKAERGGERGRERGPAPVVTASGIEISSQLVRELNSAARPGKEESLVQVFAEAVAAYAEGDIPKAIRMGENCKQMALRSPSVREFLGLAHYAAGSWKEAARELAAFRRLTGSNAQNHVIADCYRATGRPEKALEYCEQVGHADVGEDVYYEVQIVAAGALTDMDRIEDALGKLLRLDLDPETLQEHHLRAWYVLGDLLERRGRFTQARSWFEAVDAADPDLTDASDRAARLAGTEG